MSGADSKAVSKWRRNLKKRAIEYKGSKCVRCGYSKCPAALEFHHTDPSQKDFGIGAHGHTRAWKYVKIELDKCELLCSNCHREVHFEIDGGQYPVDLFSL